MKREEQLINLNQAQKLESLGVEQECRDWFYEYKINGSIDIRLNYVPALHEVVNRWAAFNVSELGKLLPSEIEHTHNEHSSYYLMIGYSATNKTKHLVYYEDNDLYMPLEILHSVDADTEASARSEMLIYLIENNLVQVQACNERLREFEKRPLGTADE